MEPHLIDDDAKRQRNTVVEDPSPRCVLEIDSDTCSCSTSSSPAKHSDSSVDDDGRATDETVGAGGGNGGGYQWKQMLASIKKKSMRRFSVIPLLTTYEMISRRNIKTKLAKVRNTESIMVDYQGLLVPTKPSWRNFDFQELAAATNNFNPENIVGEGGHAKVYKGRLPNGQIVAVKEVIKTDKGEEERVIDFLSELGIIAHINHSNAAKLVGFSIDGGLHLVLEFLPKGSLASMLHGESGGLGWSERYKVILGIARGLKYLHHECPRRIIHRDIKASNILLTEDLVAQISDFGLAKWLPENWLHHIVYPIEGTFGYLAPEYFMHGIVDEKTDVFSFGVLVLEIITGRRAIDSSRRSLVMWAKPLLQGNYIREIVDPQLEDNYDVSEMKRAMFTASICIHHLPSMRPSMNRVLQLLKGEEAILELKEKTLTEQSFWTDPISKTTPPAGTTMMRIDHCKW